MTTILPLLKTGLDEQQPEGFKKQESAEELEEGKAKSGSTTDAEEGEKPIESRPRLTSIRYQEESEKQAKLFAGSIQI